MSIELNHTIINSTDKAVSAAFLGDILGLPVGGQTGPFLPIQLSNRVTLDFADGDPSSGVRPQHYAFLVSDEEFEAAFGRIKAAGVQFWADPGHRRPGEVNDRLGGQGVYFSDPDGHNMELLTRA